MACAFCSIITGEVAAHRVFEDAVAVAFLDARPLFPGHVLVVPRDHVPTLTELPEADVGPFFGRVRLITAAVERGMAADGSFVAANNRISQSVPHFHVHVVPRRRKDGLRGFFWPRAKYADEAEAAEVAGRLRRAISDAAPGR
ncbi:HIT family protein [Streptomyces litchfieldiae]|uniref:HIT family protein n=1 Tax=Streptomyces litchfieldiae TaxID=3075543 RepID=A0ABU2MRK2_9ACTN|nr:HIT family protein [Streptomyces sp. DSM 44938]MDT0344252.1 HIT family protein [Streptomyces sp. DSM 44938]